MNNQILVFVHYKIKQGKRKEFIEVLKNAKIAERSKAEPGNVKYEVALPIEEEDMVSLLEIWKDSIAQLEHGQTVHYKELTMLKQEYVEDVVIEKYSI